MTAFDPNAWTTGELINISLFAGLYLCCLAFALWKVARAGRGRLYWIACTATIVVGTLAMIFAPPASPTDGEMPPGFGLGAWVMLLGLLATAVGAIWSLVRRLSGKA